MPHVTVVQEEWLKIDTGSIGDLVRLLAKIGEFRSLGYKATAIGVRYERPMRAFPVTPRRKV